MKKNDKGSSSHEGKYIGSAKVGPKGQIVIPKEIRDMFDISPGDTLVLMADVKQGVILHKLKFFSHIVDAILGGSKTETEPDADALEFVESIQKLQDKEEEENK